MKNIHLIPTEKPSRVYKHLGRELKHTVRYFEQKGLLCINQHIYITSDEFIEEGDWMYYKHFGEDIVCKYDTMNGQNTNVNEHKPFYQKIILTTNQDLIADGVQAIDEEFLEWFVNNPSCEEIEIVKIDTFKKTNEVYVDEITGGNYYEIIKHNKIVIPQEEPKQETLEEVVERLYPNKPFWIGSGDNARLYDEFKAQRDAFINGTKWQAEKMYSEEEVLELLRKAHFVEQNIEEWFEQFKKK
jgi:hypothetical protein